MFCDLDCFSCCCYKSNNTTQQAHFFYGLLLFGIVAANAKPYGHLLYQQMKCMYTADFSLSLLLSASATLTANV